MNSLIYSNWRTSTPVERTKKQSDWNRWNTKTRRRERNTVNGWIKRRRVERRGKTGTRWEGTKRESSVTLAKWKLKSSKIPSERVISSTETKRVRRLGARWTVYQTTCIRAEFNCKIVIPLGKRWISRVRERNCPLLPDHALTIPDHRRRPTLAKCGHNYPG